MSTDSDVRKSHFSFGIDDNLSDRRSGTYTSDYTEIDPSVYLYPELCSSPIELRRHHFDLGSDQEIFSISTNQASFVPHVNIERTKLSVAVSKDLRASHFTVGTGNDTLYETSSRVGLPHHEVTKLVKQVTLNLSKPLFPHEETSLYESESKGAYRPNWGDNKANLAQSVQDDLRRSHFTHKGFADAEYMTTAQSSYTYPKKSEVEKSHATELKHELIRSHVFFS